MMGLTAITHGVMSHGRGVAWGDVAWRLTELFSISYHVKVCPALDSGVSSATALAYIMPATELTSIPVIHIRHTQRPPLLRQLLRLTTDAEEEPCSITIRRLPLPLQLRICRRFTGNL